jgi:hypothetical protein
VSADVNGSLQSPQRHVRLSSWPALDVELPVAPVDGAGVVPLDAGPDDAEAGAAGTDAAPLPLASVTGAAAWVGETADMMERSRGRAGGWVVWVVRASGSALGHRVVMLVGVR